MAGVPSDLRGDPKQLSRFTDETSLDTRKTRGLKVPVYATVPLDSTVGWYHDLRAHFPNVAGEVKSAHVLAGFEDLPSDLRERVWKGLRAVGIHISDPRPYVDVLDESIRSVSGRPFREDELRDSAKRGNWAAKYLLEMREKHVVHLMLSSSVEVQLRRVVTGAVRRSAVFSRRDRALVDPRSEDFKGGNASLIRKVAEYTARGSAAFAAAHERAVTYNGELEYGRRFWMGPDSSDLILRGALKELEDGHAFDRSDAKVIGRLEMQRRKMVEQLVDTAFYALHGSSCADDAFIEVESTADSRVQAADVAAGLARHVFEREGLPRLVERWDTVYYNGVRVTERNLDATVRLWS